MKSQKTEIMRAMMSMEVIFTVRRKGYWERSERNEKDGANVCPTICNSKDLRRPSTARPHFRHISQSVPKAPSNSRNLLGLSAMDLEINGVHAVAEAVHSRFGTSFLKSHSTKNLCNTTYVNLDSEKILYGALFSISRGCNDTGGMFAWRVCSVGG